MDGDYRLVGGKKLRYGYTTGSTAAGAVKAAVYMLFHKEEITTVRIDTPAGKRLDLAVINICRKADSVSCAVRKDGGDDPDITDGLEIYALAERAPAGEMVLAAGEGVGRVTRRGLAVKPGRPAINPVPEKMIREGIGQVLPEGAGVKVTISIPGGEEKAKQTLNPRLGIVGGLSILGTSGLVKPMSDEAYRESLALELSTLQAEGVEEAIFAPGNYGRDFALERLELPEKLIVITSNFMGYMLDSARHYGIKKILLVGHAGKLVKVAGGIFNTHSRVADGRLEILAANYIRHYDDLKRARKLLGANTIEEAAAYIEEPRFFSLLSEEIKSRCRERTKGEIELEAVIFSYEAGELGRTDGADRLIEELKRVDEVRDNGK